MATINATNTPQLTTNGQLIIGSTGGNPQVNTLTAGTGITIMNSAGNITIAATGGGGTVTGGVNNSESGSTVFDSTTSTASTLYFNELVGGTNVQVTGGGTTTAVTIATNAIQQAFGYAYVWGL